MGLPRQNYMKNLGFPNACGIEFIFLCFINNIYSLLHNQNVYLCNRNRFLVRKDMRSQTGIERTIPAEDGAFEQTDRYANSY
jgi:hypothetical protein